MNPQSYTLFHREWRPRRPDPSHTKCGRCRRTFYAGSLPPGGPERYGPFAGTYVCSDCRRELEGPREPTEPLF